MISFIEGRIDEKNPTRVVINVGGIGYEVLIPLSSFDRLPGEGETCRLLTHFHVREDQQVLFGFMTQSEREIFQLLLGVSGIGPKIALSALSGLAPRELKTAVIEGDAKRLSTISGVGKKMAERMVLELRDKFGPADLLEASSKAGPEKTAESIRLRDATLALIALGYKQADAQRMLHKVSEKAGAKAGVEDLVRMALTG